MSRIQNDLFIFVYDYVHGAFKGFFNLTQFMALSRRLMGGIDTTQVDGIN